MTTAAPKKTKKAPAVQVRCSYCSVHLRGDRRMYALRGYYKFCAKCEKVCVDR